MLTRYAHTDEVTSEQGLVTGPEELVAEAGASALSQGGNAVDAAVAAAFAAGVVEPYMSGLGGGTTMTVALRDPDRVLVIEGHMRSPAAATPEQFPLADDEPEGGWPVSWFDWPAVVSHQNIVGPKSVGVPGTPACLCTAQERFGRLRREQVIEPALRLAADGFPVSWFFAAVTANAARSLSRDDGCAGVFLPHNGLPPRGPGVAPADRLRQPQLAETLDAIATGGAEVFYRGAIGKSIVGHLSSLGGLLSSEDLERYEPTIIEEPLRIPYHGQTVVGAPVSGLPTAAQALHLYDAARARLPRASQAEAWAHALRLALDDRGWYMTARPDVDVPWDELTSPAYAQQRLAAHLEGSAAPTPRHQQAETASPSVSPRSSLTTHMSAVDRDGNLVSLTQTVMNTYGARVLDPQTGVLLNDGMAYFDTRPGSLNGIRPDSPVFSSMMPVVLVDDERGPTTAVGASGGRRIMSGSAQIIEALAVQGMTLQDAIEAPRIHVEQDHVVLDVRWPEGTAEQLEDVGFTVELTQELPTTVHFARPNGVRIERDGRCHSGVDPNKPGGAVPG